MTGEKPAAAFIVLLLAAAAVCLVLGLTGSRMPWIPLAIVLGAAAGLVGMFSAIAKAKHIEDVETPGRE